MTEEEKNKIIEKENLYLEEGIPKKKQKNKTMLLVFTFILFVVVTAVTSYIVMNYFVVKNKNLNVDTNGDGWPDLNVDTDGDKICNVNCDTNKDNKPDYNIGYKNIVVSYFNVDTNGDLKPDFNLINQDTNNDGICDINCDIDNDNKPDINVDFDVDGIVDLNIDLDGDNKCDINCDFLGNRYATVNLDQDGDLKADINIDTNNDGIPDININYGSDYGTPVFNVDKNNDGKIQYVLLEGEAGHQDAISRTDCSVKTIINNGINLEKLSYQFADWNRGQAENRTTQLIDQYGNNIEMIISNNDEMAIGAVEAYKKSGYGEDEWPIICGIDGLNDALIAVKEGQMQGTVYNDKEDQSMEIAKLVVDIFKGNDLKKHNLDSGKYYVSQYKKVDINNVDDFISR